MEHELIELVLADTRERMAKAIDHVKSEFSAVRTGRANSALVENLEVDRSEEHTSELQSH